MMKNLLTSNYAAITDMNTIQHKVTKFRANLLKLVVLVPQISELVSIERIALMQEKENLST
jgi:hypothetical protein